MSDKQIPDAKFTEQKYVPPDNMGNVTGKSNIKMDPKAKQHIENNSPMGKAESGNQYPDITNVLKNIFYLILLTF